MVQIFCLLFFCDVFQPNTQPPQVAFEITGGGTVSEEEEEEKHDPQWTRYRRQRAAARKAAGGGNSAGGGAGERHRRGAWTAAAQRCAIDVRMCIRDACIMANVVKATNTRRYDDGSK